MFEITESHGITVPVLLIYKEICMQFYNWVTFKLKLDKSSRHLI